MSRRHPIIAVTGSSGAGTTTTGQIFSRMFASEGIAAAMVSGDSFHRYTREQMARLAAKGQFGERNHFALAANHIDRLEALFYDYSHTGNGRYRQYVHDEDRDLIAAGHKPGTFTPWGPLPADTDALFYEGLHGGVVSDNYNIAQYVDLLIGVVPIVNLEWIQKIHRDTHQRGYSQDAVVQTIINRMDDYVHDIVPQFSHTHINFQRIPLVDTSNPFVARDVPSEDDSRPRGGRPFFRPIQSACLARKNGENYCNVPGTLLDCGQAWAICVNHEKYVYWRKKPLKKIDQEIEVIED